MLASVAIPENQNGLERRDLFPESTRPPSMPVSVRLSSP
jgi:hypothetical protein